MRTGFGMEYRDVLGSRVTVGDRQVTPVARSLIARWPGGGSVSSSPAAVIVEHDGGTERIPIRNLNRRLLWTIRAGTVGLIGAWILMHRRRRPTND